MSYQYLKEESYYEDLYDRHTVEECRSNERVVNKTFSEMEKKEEFAEEFKSHLTGWYLQYSQLYFQLVETVAYLRSKGREEAIRIWMEKDEAKDRRIAEARLTKLPYCKACGKDMGAISKDYMPRKTEGSANREDEILFMLECRPCKKRIALWEDGSEWEGMKTFCPRCRSEMKHSDKKEGDTITTTYDCPSCSHTYQDTLDLGEKYVPEEPEEDPFYELDRRRFCFDGEMQSKYERKFHHLTRVAQLHLDANHREEHKEEYDAVKEIKQLKVIELSTALKPLIEEAGYAEFKLGDPEFGRETSVPFSCLDGKPERAEYDSKKGLQKIISSALEGTNWRLMSEGVSYRLGYLSGRLRAYESEEDMRKLVEGKAKKAPQKEERPVRLDHAFDFENLSFDLKRGVLKSYFEKMTIGSEPVDTGEKHKKKQTTTTFHLNPDFGIIIPMREDDPTVPSFVRNFSFVSSNTSITGNWYEREKKDATGSESAK